LQNSLKRRRLYYRVISGFSIKSCCFVCGARPIDYIVNGVNSLAQSERMVPKKQSDALQYTLPKYQNKLFDGEFTQVG